MASHDYFTYDERPDGQSVQVGAAQSTPWGRFPTFFVVKGVILSEKPDAPDALAEGYARVQQKLQRAADQLDARTHRLNEEWSEGPASVRYFWFAGATLYGLDQWVENLDVKIKRLTDLVVDIGDAHAKAEELEQRFKAEYQSKAPPGAAFYGFPPNLDLNNPAVDDDEEVKLKAKIAAVYEAVHAKYLKLIIKLGQKLAKRFVEAAKWMGTAGKVPVRFQGPDIADPWRPYTPEALTPAPIPMRARQRLSEEFTRILVTVEPGPTAPLSVGVPDRADPSASWNQSVNPLGLGPTTGDPRASATGDPGASATGAAGAPGVGGSALLGRGTVGGMLPIGTSPPVARGQRSWSAGTSHSAAHPSAALAGRFGEPPAPAEEVLPSAPAEEALPSALTARGAPLPMAATDGLSAGTTGAGPMGSPMAAASGMHQALTARTMLPVSDVDGGWHAARERSGVLGERRTGTHSTVRPSAVSAPDSERRNTEQRGPADRLGSAVHRTVA